MTHSYCRDTSLCTEGIHRQHQIIRTSLEYLTVWPRSKGFLFSSGSLLCCSSDYSVPELIHLLLSLLDQPLLSWSIVPSTHCHHCHLTVLTDAWIVKYKFNQKASMGNKLKWLFKIRKEQKLSEI